MHDQNHHNRTQPFSAVIMDMDGVITKTAVLHQHAWQQMFNKFLRDYPDQPEFSQADYRAHVDGKPRYDGVQAFLDARGIQLPKGSPSDTPEQQTVYGLGKRKNTVFLQLLEEHGVEVFDDAVVALRRWRRSQLKVAVISSSRNCRRVMSAAQLTDKVDLIVDGKTAADLHLKGKPEIIRHAVQQLQVDAQDAIVFEDATAGVRAARQENIGMVIGVSRNGHVAELTRAGADSVTNDIRRVRFLRPLPNALENLDEIVSLHAPKSLAFFLDFDGTLAEIVDDPNAAGMTEAMRATLVALTKKHPVAIISGRDRQDVQARIGIDGIFYAGNHGFDIAGPGHTKILPEAEAALEDVRKAEHYLRAEVQSLEGVMIERKRFSVAVHYRQVKQPAIRDAVKEIVAQAAQQTGLRKRRGKKVYELEPAVAWDKGKALQWLWGVIPAVKSQHCFTMYIGDDETDEDAFAVLDCRGAGIRVADEVSDSLADYHLLDPEQVKRFLELLQNAR